MPAKARLLCMRRVCFLAFSLRANRFLLPLVRVCTICACFNRVCCMIWAERHSILHVELAVCFATLSATQQRRMTDNSSSAAKTVDPVLGSKTCVVCGKPGESGSGFHLSYCREHFSSAPKPAGSTAAAGAGAGASAGAGAGAAAGAGTTAGAAAPAKKAAPKFGGGDKCLACGKSVYANEAVSTSKGKVHSSCFKSAKSSLPLGKLISASFAGAVIVQNLCRRATTAKTRASCIADSEYGFHSSRAHNSLILRVSCDCSHFKKILMGGEFCFQLFSLQLRGRYTQVITTCDALLYKQSARRFGVFSALPE